MKETQYEMERQQGRLRISKDTVVKRSLSGPIRKQIPVPASSNLQYADLTSTEKI
jgi:hypothetical protein